MPTQTDELTIVNLGGTAALGSSTLYAHQKPTQGVRRMTMRVQEEFGIGHIHAVLPSNADSRTRSEEFKSSRCWRHWGQPR